jgi:hypothetical protein
MQYVEKNFMKVNYNMLIQNHVYYNMLSKKITLWGGGAMVKDLISQCGGEEFKSPHSNPHICNLGYLGYLGDIIR